jgi:glycosyltransferase involved in cell wall biosynthesis
VGGGHLLPEVKRGVGSSFPRAVFTDGVAHDEVYAFLAASDAALIPWHHSFTSPLKLFEYMAAGLPVVAADVGGIAEVLRHGENGLPFRLGDGPAMAQAMLQLIRDSDLRARLGEAARQEVFEKYTWEANARKVVDLALALSRADETKEQ